MCSRPGRWESVLAAASCWGRGCCTGLWSEAMCAQPASDNNRGERKRPHSGRFSYEGLDRIMHEKARLGILASLAANAGGLLFNDLKALCHLTDGNLSRHLAVLSDA